MKNPSVVWPPGYGLKELPSLPQALDQKLVDFKPERPLSGPGSADIASVIPAIRLECSYSRLPRFEAMNALFGVDPNVVPVAEYVAARDAYMGALPVSKLPFNNKIVVSQSRVNVKQVAEMAALIASGEAKWAKKPVYVLANKGLYYILNGHHRLAALYAAGERGFPAHVLEVA